MPCNMDFLGRVPFILGAPGGLGTQFARTLARQATVLVFDR
jgi:NAD(P)-dependent dehydrogenase (short-subunit alcohol dehydrogenase family)